MIMVVSSEVIVEKTDQVQLSIILPVYNQEGKITNSLSVIKECIKSTLQSYELVVVNDGSLDNTLSYLTKEKESDPNLRVISYTQNKGKGHAVKIGITQSRGSKVIFMDGDLGVSPAAIKDCLADLKNWDLVIGSKRHPASRVISPFSRKFLSRAFNFYVRVMTGTKIKDTQSGFKAGDGTILRWIFNAIHDSRYAFDVELLAIANLMRLRIKELPVEVNIDRRFRIYEIFKMFFDVLSISYRYRIRKYYPTESKSIQNFLTSPCSYIEIKDNDHSVYRQ